MKKSIESLVGKLQEDASGQLKGGFGSIRGGAVKKIRTTNMGACTNSTVCDSNNPGICSNTGVCENTTNISHCSNTYNCPIS